MGVEIPGTGWGAVIRHCILRCETYRAASLKLCPPAVETRLRRGTPILWQPPTRYAAVVPLHQALTTQLRTIEALDPGCNPPAVLPVVLCFDGTRVWQQNVTRCDFCVMPDWCCQSIGQPERWGTWWVLDGSDDSVGIRLLHHSAELDNEVRILQQEGNLWECNCILQTGGCGYSSDRGLDFL